jgi:predicted AAA+ superfamily ATPase
VQAALADTRVVRQVGKSTLVAQIAEGEPGRLVITLDDEARRRGAIEDPTGFVADLDTPVAIDEVDMVLERRDGTVVGIEAKAAASAARADFHGLRLMRERLGERFAFGALLYTGPATVPFGDRLAAIPLQGLWC